jgi:FxsC-like protein
MYGDSSQEWRPFAGRQALSAAAYVASISERLGLPTTIVDFAGSVELFGRYPAVLLIDPWILDRVDGEREFQEAVKRLPPWVMPLLVIDDGARESTRGTQIVREAVAMLVRAGVPEPQGVGRMQEFVDIMPTLVTEARRQYLRHGRVNPPIGDPPPRIRLRDHDAPPPAQPGMMNDD